MQKEISDSKHTNLVDLKTVKKILEVLAVDGRVKRTQLSVKTGMNYERCMRYVHILKLIRLVEVVLENNCSYVVATQAGMEIINFLDHV
ncbi:MAG TPA: hypothetical protein VFU58_03235 [Candidatus Nitrosotalea sp.]|nr:hypothetical protein [Candidatus Nitrosotalea sp.]